LKEYIFYSTIFCLFSEALQIHFGIDIKLFYLIVLTNFFFLLVKYGSQVKFNYWHLATLLYLGVTGIASVATGTNKIGPFLEQIVGISVTSIYFYLFLKTYSSLGILRIFNTYANFCYIIALIGFSKLFVQLFLPVDYWRFESIFKEPAHYITVVFPSIYYFYKTGAQKKFFVMLLSLLLTLSAVGYIGLVIAILINSKVNTKYLFFSLLFAIIFLTTAYKTSVQFAERIDDTVVAISSADIGKANLSSYALVSNLLVAVKSFQFNPIFGSGLGSHQLSHDKYISKLAGIENFDQYLNLNSNDANSLLLRVISDLGLTGTVLVFIFLLKHYSRKTDTDSIITKGIFLYFFCKLLREGHYFSPEMYFFVFLYYFNAKQSPKNPDIIAKTALI